MTTRIEVKNDGPSIVEVFAVDTTEFEKKVGVSIVAPGGTVSKYVWKDTATVVQEQE
jgi:hypothetical protein